MPPPTEPKLPFDPLYQYLDRPELAVVAEQVGVAKRTVNRWLRDGMPTSRADEVAVRVGVHPSAIWGEDWWEVA